MSKAEHALITSAKPTPTRQSILSTGAQIAGAAVIGSVAGISSDAAVAALYYRDRRSDRSRPRAVRSSLR